MLINLHYLFQDRAYFSSWAWSAGSIALSFNLCSPCWLLGEYNQLLSFEHGASTRTCVRKQQDGLIINGLTSLNLLLIYLVQKQTFAFLEKKKKQLWHLYRPTLSYFPHSLCPKYRPSCADTITLLVTEWGRKDSKVLVSHFCLWGSGSLQQRNSRAKKNGVTTRH